MKYFDWAKTLSYKADVTMVVTERGFGKTYGLRKQFVRDYLKHGARFVEFTRYKNEVAGVSRGYFDKLEENNEFPSYRFKTDNARAYIASASIERPKGDDWECIGYFVPLSTAQSLKKMTFRNVYRLVLDEAIIDKRINQYSRYLKNEFEILTNAIDSVTRERADNVERLHPKLYLLGNACDMLNPYFIAFGVNKVPEHGYTWFNSKKFLLAYPKNKGYARQKAKDTLAGRMASMSDQKYSALENKFKTGDLTLIERKPSSAVIKFGWLWKGIAYSYWDDEKGTQCAYICKGFPKGSGAPFVSVSPEDQTVDLRVAERDSKYFMLMKYMYHYALLRYDSERTRNTFFEVMKLFGVRNC